MSKRFETHQREYNLISVTICFHEFFSKEFTDFFGGKPITEAIQIIKDGIYFWSAKPGEFESQTRGFMKRVEKNEIDLMEEYRRCNLEVGKYEKLIFTPKSKYKLSMFKDFQGYYERLFRVVLYAAYAVDCIDEISPRKRKKAEEILTKIRLRTERVNKDGEKKFLPKYLSWLAENYLQSYSADELRYVLSGEMSGYLNDGKMLPSKSELNRRKKAFVYYFNNRGQSVVVSGREAIAFIRENKIFDEVKHHDVSELTGQIAQVGKVTGRVRIILSTKDLPKFKKGEVIVSQMTDPSYLPAMKKAVAFITDEGGTLCHAAIVARELKKPCIIGTKIATKILKDGDLVEVDANSGIIKILNNN